jgi:hypothetical protein
VKFFGVIVDSELTWIRHIKYTCSRLSRITFLVRKLKPIIPEGYLKTVYYALFQSVISYGIVIWGSSPHIVEILLIQKKVIRIMSGASRNEHCRPLFVNLDIMTIVNL